MGIEGMRSVKGCDAFTPPKPHLSQADGIQREGETQRRMMGGCAAEQRGNAGRRVNRKQRNDKKIWRNRESRSAEMICLISKTTPMTEPFCISQRFWTFCVSTRVWPDQTQRRVILIYLCRINRIKRCDAASRASLLCVAWHISVNDTVEITKVKHIPHWTAYGD